MGEGAGEDGARFPQLSAPPPPLLHRVHAHPGRGGVPRSEARRRLRRLGRPRPRAGWGSQGGVGSQNPRHPAIPTQKNMERRMPEFRICMTQQFSTRPNGPNGFPSSVSPVFRVLTSQTKALQTTLPWITNDPRRLLSPRPSHPGSRPHPPRRRPLVPPREVCGRSLGPRSPPVPLPRSPPVSQHSWAPKVHQHHMITDSNLRWGVRVVIADFVPGQVGGFLCAILMFQWFKIPISISPIGSLD